MPIESVHQEIAAGQCRDRMQRKVSKKVSGLAKEISAHCNLQYLQMSSQPDMFDPTAVSPGVGRSSVRRTSGKRP